MFKKYADFSAVHGTKTHPGQPLHCDDGFDVFPHEKGAALHPTKGEPITFGSVAEAVKHARTGSKEPGQAAPVAKPLDAPKPA